MPFIWAAFKKLALSAKSKNTFNEWISIEKNRGMINKPLKR